ncbi:hypothetical protein DTO280E4_7015 [Paecilomyces variotii]|nr:hypothetical protein DTO169E5_5477 [Paecilomyces variotii]KAJ9269558.1 hypothetical protein DTO212C5_4409 [Paecilomyces variotii]KAJ9354133.1 hypothetical protein DTO280E4_7015 [Paecilomyces variotii]
MVSSSPAPVGSGIFFAFALVTISVLVLLLLRRFLTLRATPAYIIVPVFLALALPASVVLLVPIDLTSSSRANGRATGIWLPDRMVLVSWRIAYWLIFVLTWIILPLLGEFVDSGYRDPKGRLMYSLRSNGRYQLTVLCCGIVGLIYISIQNGFDFTSIKGLVMALAYVWGLILAIYLMGHGLVSIPRTLLRNANASGRLRRIQARAPKVHDRLMDAITDLEELEATVSQLQRRKTGSAREFTDWIEELAETCNSSESQPLAGQSIAEATATVPAVITERYMADLTRRLQRARHRRARFLDEWDRLVQSAAETQAIIDSYASKKLDFGRTSPHASFLSRAKFLTPYMRYHLHVNILPSLRLLFAGIFAVASVCIIWSELIKSFAPKLSVISLTVVPHSSDPGAIGFGGQVTASAWLLYMCTAALVGMYDAKVWGNRALVRRNTYGESACWYAGQVAKLTVPLSYNFLTFLPEEVQRNTTFYKFLGRLINLTPLGKGFDYFFPVFIFLPVCATMFNLYGKMRRIFSFGILEEDDDSENDPSGIGAGGWREGRELIERELSGLGSLGLASRNTDTVGLPTGVARGRATNRAALATWTPPAEGSRPARSTRTAATASRTVAPELDDEEEGFFQSFFHRVKNTYDTSNVPQWFQGDQFPRPRWMSGSGAAEGGGSGLARWFGKQTTSVRL